jgi:hypothetical protein
MRRGRWNRAVVVSGLAAPVVAVALLVVGVTAAQTVNYCQVIPQVPVAKEAWGFHGGKPITGATGSYTRGHGQINLSAQTANGVICQVDRVRNAPDRQIVLAVGRDVIYTSHHAVEFGVPGNIMKIHVRVKSTTDPRCRRGTHGVVTIFASYNNVHEDLVQFSFPVACKDHRHRYTGPSVVTNVPPN